MTTVAIAATSQMPSALPARKAPRETGLAKRVKAVRLASSSWTLSEAPTTARNRPLSTPTATPAVASMRRRSWTSKLNWPNR
jgi:hypothetical protein